MSNTVNIIMDSAANVTLAEVANVKQLDKWRSMFHIFNLVTLTVGFIALGVSLVTYTAAPPSPSNVAEYAAPMIYYGINSAMVTAHSAFGALSCVKGELLFLKIYTLIGVTLVLEEIGVGSWMMITVNDRIQAVISVIKKMEEDHAESHTHKRRMIRSQSRRDTLGNNKDSESGGHRRTRQSGEPSNEGKTMDDIRKRSEDEHEHGNHIHSEEEVYNNEELGSDLVDEHANDDHDDDHDDDYDDGDEHADNVHDDGHDDDHDEDGHEDDDHDDDDHDDHQEGEEVRDSRHSQIDPREHLKYQEINEYYQCCMYATEWLREPHPNFEKIYSHCLGDGEYFCGMKYIRFPGGNPMERGVAVNCNCDLKVHGVINTRIKRQTILLLIALPCQVLCLICVGFFIKFEITLMNTAPTIFNLYACADQRAHSD